MANELKLMPCCGEVPAIKYFAGFYGSRMPCYEVKCAICFSGVHVDVINLTERGKNEARKHAINRWNRRATDGAK